ncbi:hypothetical protein HBA55_29455 [Pseudomaricurvus alkylphenolicus]|uniref:hypothetical protein n=1 Tax=Pseudomaricurvus alkylphenolicus TaxID=1306991 RepID=UPI00141FC59D|nr:hypothetical protein [Pseudomaricurvus alkylphenolicus]NIB43765.1 hypothetical protein [Pseudomaricurvus alkylphenolicus]
MKKAATLVSIIALSTALIACGSKEVSWKTQETQRALAIENSEFNARAFRMKNNRFASWNIMGRGDSTIGPECANGDGWASVDLVNPKTGGKQPLKCSTASANIGCLLKRDFAERNYSQEEGQCNTNLPVPMPKIAK